LIDLKAVLLSHKPHDEILTHICRECIIQQAALCFHGFESILDDPAIPENIIYNYLKGVAEYTEIVFLLSTGPWNTRENIGQYLFINFELKMPDDKKKTELWEKFSAEYALSGGIDLVGAANKFKFTPFQIKNAIQDTILLSNRENGGVIDEDTFYRACYNQVSHSLDKKATRIEPVYSWDDLILPKEQKDQLRAACSYVKYKNVVFGKWGFDEKMPYGRGLSILFSGPPGTGKTMGAQVMAKELHLKIYKVDMSQVISKYIGETEKNLYEVFSEAGESNAILFFDEADAIFGKRTNVKDSHDKYANVETSFLLQKIEEYDGISILASNYLQNIDEAFLRRITFIIKFPFPDADYRKQIWTSVFPKKAELSRGIDFGYLAGNFELSGSSIKSIALAASFMAVSDGMPISMLQLVKCIYRELGKGGKVVMKEQFREYAHFLK